MFSLPTGTEMFHFPALPPNWLYIHQQVTRHHSRRVSPFGHPRIHARLTAPRGITQPPTSFIGSRCQGIHHAPLNTYNTKNQKNEFRDLYKRNSEIAHQHTRKAPTPERIGATCVLDARNHYPQIKHHTPPPRWSDNQVLSPVSHIRDEEIAGLLPQSPIVCLMIPSAGISPPASTLVECTRTTPTTGAAHLHDSLESPNPHTMWAGSSLVVLLRKEVIQPHLPVRLPCYDFVPIADPTFDGSLPKGLGHRLRVLPTFMT